MATIDFNKLEFLLDSGGFYLPTRVTKTPLKILAHVNMLEFHESIEARVLAAKLKVAENTCRQYLRWLGQKGLVWVTNQGQGGVMIVKPVNSPW